MPAGSPVPKVSKIAAGHYHSFMLTTNGELYAWGDNRRGQLGLGNFISQPVPTLLTAKNGQPVRFTNVATGLYTTIAVADRMALFEVQVFVPPPCKDMGSAGFQSGTIVLQEDKATPAPTRVPTKLGDELGFIPCVVATMTTAPTSKKAAIALRETKSPTAPVSLADLLSVSLAPAAATSAPEFVYIGPFKGKGAVVNYTADPDFEGFITAAPTDGGRRRLLGWDTAATTEPIVPLDRSAAGRSQRQKHVSTQAMHNARFCKRTPTRKPRRSSLKRRWILEMRRTAPQSRRRLPQSTSCTLGVRTSTVSLESPRKWRK